MCWHSLLTSQGSGKKQALRVFPTIRRSQKLSFKNYGQDSGVIAAPITLHIKYLVKRKKLNVRKKLHLAYLCTNERFLKTLS